MKKFILSAIALGTLSAGLVGCGFYGTDAATGKDAAVGAHVTHYDGRVVTGSDLRVYHRDPKHVFVYDGVRYRVKSHRNQFVYYRI